MGLIATCPSLPWILCWSCPSKRNDCTTCTCLLLKTCHCCRSQCIYLRSWKAQCRSRSSYHCWTFHSIFQFMTRSVLCHASGRISTLLSRRFFLWGLSIFRFLTFHHWAIILHRGSIHWQTNQIHCVCCLWTVLNNKTYLWKIISPIHIFRSLWCSTLQYTVFLCNTKQPLWLGIVWVRTLCNFCTFWGCSLTNLVAGIQCWNMEVSSG